MTDSSELDEIISLLEPNLIKHLKYLNTITTTSHPVPNWLAHELRTKTYQLSRLSGEMTNATGSVEVDLKQIVTKTYNYIQDSELNEELKSKLINFYLKNIPQEKRAYTYLKRLDYLFSQFNKIKEHKVDLSEAKYAWFNYNEKQNYSLDTKIRQMEEEESKDYRQLSRGKPTAKMIAELPDYMREYALKPIRKSN